MVHSSQLLLGCSREPREPGRLIVKRTFLELVDATTEAALFRRACSDPAIFESAAQQSRSPGGAEDAESEVGDLDFHLNGLSDAETSSDLLEEKIAAAASSDRLSSDAPRSESGCSGVPSEFSAEELSREDAASDHTEAELRAGLLPPCRVDIEALVSENLRLQMENQRLRESARQTWGEGDVTDQRAQCHLAMPLNEGAGATVWCFVPAMLPGAAAQAHLAAASPSAAGALAGCAGEEPTMDADGRTTVMLRNLPNNYSRAMVLAMLDLEGFAGLYDFLYLPIDFNSQACLGYAFVNLTDPSLVPAFWNTFNGFSNWVLPSRKVCRVSWSGPHQGLEEHVARYRNSPVMHSCVPDEFKPVIFINGVRVQFPESTKAPRAPRIRHHVGFKSRSSWSSRLATGQGQ